MSSADLATVIIACPNCGTQYQVPFGAVGASGRDVQCAQCGKTWHATAEPPPPPAPVSVPAVAAPPAGDVMFSAEDEAALDTAFEAAATAEAPPSPAKPSISAEHQRTLDEIRAAIAPKPKLNDIDPAALSKSQKAFTKRQQGLAARLPLARMRRTARLAAFVALLSVLMLGYALRFDLVMWFPQLAGLYAAVGLPVNVIGLEFSDAKTLTLLRDGKTVMQISAKIRAVAGRSVHVPPVLVSLLDAKGAPVYQWTVTPPTPNMDPGDIVPFTTEMNSPPDAAVTVRLSFTTAGGSVATPATAQVS